MDARMNMLMSMLSRGRPQDVIQQTLQNNPQFNAILNQAKQSGMSMKDFTMQYAKQNNINIQPMLDLLAQRGFKF